MSSIFISYAKEDFQYAEEIFYFLKDEGFHPWMDKKNLLPGQNWKHILEEKLKQVDFILVIISNTSISKRGYVQKEFRRAVEYWEERPESDIYLLPVKIDECEVPPSLDKFHWIEYTSEDFKTKIREAITIQANKLYSQKIENKTNTNKEFEDDYMKSPIQNPKGGIGINKSRIFIAILVICSIFIGISFFSISNSSAELTPIAVSEKEKVYNFVLDYFDNLHSQKQIEETFADHIDTFYTRSNLTRMDIMKIRNENDEFLNARHKIDKESLTFINENNGSRYWSFLSRFVCFRKSKNKFEFAKVIMEFGINKDFRITSIKEKVLEYKFTKEKPTI